MPFTASHLQLTKVILKTTGAVVPEARFAVVHIKSAFAAFARIFGLYMFTFFSGKHGHNIHIVIGIPALRLAEVKHAGRAVFQHTVVGLADVCGVYIPYGVATNTIGQLISYRCFLDE